MARRTQLLSLVAQLRAETGRTQKVSVGTDEVDNLKRILQRVQESLYDAHDWAHLRAQDDISLSAGQRYHDLPANLNFDRIENVKLKYNGKYIKIDRGIDLTDYSWYDSNATVPARSSPIQKWDIRFTGSTEQIEVWPIPADDNQKIYFKGFYSLSPLIQEADRADLDDILIVLYAAAEILARQGAKDAQAKLAQADARLGTLMKNYAKASPVIQIGLGKRRDISSYKTVLVVGG